MRVLAAFVVSLLLATSCTRAADVRLSGEDGSAKKPANEAAGFVVNL